MHSGFISQGTGWFNPKENLGENTYGVWLVNIDGVTVAGTSCFLSIGKISGKQGLRLPLGLWIQTAAEQNQALAACIFYCICH